MTKASDYHSLYSLREWKRLRHHQLRNHPLCAFCHNAGITEAATIVDHIRPHKGDLELFLDPNNLQSLCKVHHDSTKAFIEKRGYSLAVDRQGIPIDPRHPCNRLKR